VCRSKKVYEALLFKNGKTTSWHKEARIIYHADHAIKSHPLLQFAHDTFGFPIGDLHYEDKSGCFVNELTKTRRVMRPCDWNQRVWRTRGLTFDEEGNLILKVKVSKKSTTTATKPVRESDGDSDEEDEDKSGSDEEE
jgi:hypothetical protein